MTLGSELSLIKAHKDCEDSRDGLVTAEQNLVTSEIAIRTTCLDLGDLLLVETQLAVDADDVLTDRQARHAEL